MKKSLYIIILLFFVVFYNYSKIKVPLFVKTQEQVLSNLSDKISRELPGEVDILFYDFSVLNGNASIEGELNQEFFNFFKKEDKQFDFKVIFMKDINREELNVDFSFLKNQDELELIAFGKYIEQDCVILSTITILDNKFKKVWVDEKRSFVKRQVALYQGNIFSTDDNQSLIRFSYYMLLK